MSEHSKQKCETSPSNNSSDRISRVELHVEMLQQDQREFREQVKEILRQHHKDMTDLTIKHNEDMATISGEIMNVHKIIASQAEKHNKEINTTNKALETTNENFDKLDKTINKWAQRIYGGTIVLATLYFVISGQLPDFINGLIK